MEQKKNNRGICSSKCSQNSVEFSWSDRRIHSWNLQQKFCSRNLRVRNCSASFTAEVFNAENSLEQFQFTIEITTEDELKLSSIDMNQSDEYNWSYQLRSRSSCALSSAFIWFVVSQRTMEFILPFLLPFAVAAIIELFGSWQRDCALSGAFFLRVVHIDTDESHHPVHRARHAAPTHRVMSPRPLSGAFSPLPIAKVRVYHFDIRYTTIGFLYLTTYGTRNGPYLSWWSRETDSNV